MDADDWIAISALQHYSYCPRQCALIHMEQQFAENLFTARGQALHHLADIPDSEQRAGIRIERAMLLACERLHLSGRADVVEFLPDGTPYPVEYKHGPRRDRRHDNLQLAAQALCLEEMTGHAVPLGAIYHASSHRRREISIDVGLKQQVELTVGLVRKMLDSHRLPVPANDSRCRDCSLVELCQPKLLSDGARLAVLRQQLFDAED